MGNRRWSLEEKRAAVERMKVCGHVRLAAELNVDRRQLYAWRKQLRALDRGESEGWSEEQRLRAENERLKRTLAEKVMEADFLQGVLRRIEARRRPGSGAGETASTERSKP